jgi:hypothetical protein
MLNVIQVFGREGAQAAVKRNAGVIAASTTPRRKRTVTSYP